MYDSTNLSIEQIDTICNGLRQMGLPMKEVGRFRKILVEAGTWRASAAPYPASVAKAIAGLALKGFPQCAGEPMVFPFSLDTVAGTPVELVLKPRKPVWAIGMVTDDPTAVAATVCNAFEYAGDQIYPSAGEDSNGFVRVKDPQFFTFAALDSDASPWPMGMLLNDELSLRIEVTDPGVVTWSGNVYCVSLKEDENYRRLLDEVKKTTR